MKHFVLFLLFIFLPTFVSAESSAPKNKSEKEITTTTTQAMQLAGALVGRGDFEHATQILTKTPKMNNVALEIERSFLS